MAEPVSHTIVVRGEEGLALHVVAWAPVPGSTPSEPSFLLVHGLASNARLWDGVALDLAAAGTWSTSTPQVEVTRSQPMR